jgi:hypothetical protein
MFNKLFQKKINYKKPYFVIGVDTFDKKYLTYSLGRTDGDNLEIILHKSLKDDIEFKQEVENLSKYFNAEVFSNKNWK